MSLGFLIALGAVTLITFSVAMFSGNGDEDLKEIPKKKIENTGPLYPDSEFKEEEEIRHILEDAESEEEEIHPWKVEDLYK